MRPEEVAAVRKLEALHHALGEAVLGALAEPRVVEVLANPDGRLVVDALGEGRRDTGVRLSASARERVIRLVAEHVGEPVTRDDPRLSGVLPSGERFQGFLPPVSAQPTFSIRKRPAVIWTLADYVDQGVMSAAQADLLREAVVARRNILISGGTGSGKTTLANALLAEPAFAGDRVFLLEDTPELQCSAWDLLLEVAVQPPRRAIAQAIDLIVQIRRTRDGRRIDGLVALDGLTAHGAYQLTELNAAGRNRATSATSSDRPAATEHSRNSTPNPKQHTSHKSPATRRKVVSNYLHLTS